MREHGGLYLTSNKKGPKIYVPAAAKAIHSEILRLCYDSPTSGHLAAAKLLDSVQRFYHWPGIAQTVAKYVKTCQVSDACQHSKSSN